MRGGPQLVSSLPGIRAARQPRHWRNCLTPYADVPSAPPRDERSSLEVDPRRTPRLRRLLVYEGDE